MLSVTLFDLDLFLLCKHVLAFFDASMRDFKKVLQTVMSSLTKSKGKIKINLQRHLIDA